MTDMHEDIKRCDRLVRECNVRAMSSKGVSRWVFLRFAKIFDWAGQLGREIERDEQRGKDDSYHDEY